MLTPYFCLHRKIYSKVLGKKKMQVMLGVIEYLEGRVWVEGQVYI